jgi:PAS domain S-box-containing protein
MEPATQTTGLGFTKDAASSESSFLKQLSSEEQLAHFAAIIEQSSDAIFSANTEGRILSWNPSAERIYGYSAQEMIGNNIRIVVPPENLSELLQVVEHLRDGRLVESFETRRRRKDGREIDVHLTISPVLDHSGILIGTSTIARDITDRKATQRELRRKQRELEDYFENSVIGLHWVGPDGTILWANKAEMNLLGYSPEEYIGQHIAKFHADSGAINDILCRLGKNEKLHGYEARLKCKDGSLRDVLINSSVLWDENNNFVHTRCFTLDVTERKRTDAALIRAEKMAATGRLAATIAHEVNNPLEAVTNLIYLANEASSLEEAQRFLQLAGPELERVAQLTKQTLGFFRDPTAPKSLNLSKLVSEVVSLYQRKLDTADLNVETQLEASMVMASEGELRQVLANLLTNAIDASRAGSLIRIRVGTKGAQVQLTIADEGTGVSPQIAPKIFEPFFTTKGERGNGLGLWVTQGIVNKHHGSLRMRSFTSTCKSGTVFSIFLPAAPTARQL